MAKSGHSEMSKGLILSIAALIVWGAAGIAVLQFLSGGDLLGVLFAIVAVVLLVIAAEGSAVARLVGRPTSKVQMLVLVGVLLLVGINELWGLFLVPVRSGAIFLTHVGFTVGLLAFIVLTARHAIKLTRSS